MAAPVAAEPDGRSAAEPDGPQYGDTASTAGGSRSLSAALDARRPTELWRLADLSDRDADGAPIWLELPTATA
jgi:hypothetical protein